MMNPNKFDPSQLDPKTLMKLSELVRQLPPEKLGRMQTMMHNMMAGFDVRKEMEEFEKGLPPGFREQIMSSFMGAGMGAGVDSSMGSTRPSPAAQADLEIPRNSSPASETLSSTEETSSPEMNLRDARLTLLRGVANGELSPEEAERLLFTDR
jgi:hypothetical protein